MTTRTDMIVKNGLADLIGEEVKFRWFRSVQDRSILDEYYLSDSIGAPKHYVDMIHAIRSMQQTDVAHIYINSCGGAISTAVQIMSAIDECEGTVICHAEGECMSAGTLLLLKGHGVMVHAHTMCMFHDFSTVVAGSGDQIKKEIEATHGWVWDIAKDIYSGVLTEDEIAHIAENNAIWLTTKDMVPRLEKLADQRKAEAEEAAAAKLAELNQVAQEVAAEVAEEEGEEEIVVQIS